MISVDQLSFVHSFRFPDYERTMKEHRQCHRHRTTLLNPSIRFTPPPSFIEPRDLIPPIFPPLSPPTVFHHHPSPYPPPNSQFAYRPAPVCLTLTKPDALTQGNGISFFPPKAKLNINRIMGRREGLRRWSGNEPDMPRHVY